MRRVLCLASLLLVAVVATVVFAADAAVMLDARSGTWPTSSFDEKDAADLLAHITGLSPLHPKTPRTNFPSIDLFARPNSNLFVTVDGVGTALLGQLQRSALRFFASQHSHTASLTQDLTTSRSSIAAVTTLLTGEMPVVHGIFGRSWLAPESSEELVAFASTQTRTPTVADVLLTTLPESLVVAISADRVLARALGPHPQTAGDVRIFFWDATLSAFVSAAGEQVLSRDEIVALLPSLPLPAGASLEISGENLLRFSLPGGVWASYDLSIEQDLALFAELVAISHLMPSQLAGRVVPVERACDFLSVGVASIRALEERYGTSSTQVLAALYLADAALAQLETRLDVIYAQQTTRQTVLLGASVMAGQRAARAVLSVSDTGLDTASSSNTTYTPQQVADYQISIWGTVFLVVALVVPIYTFLNMDTSSDSILYRIAAPRLS